MVYIILVQLIGVLFAATPAAPEGRIFTEAGLGEKKIDLYIGRSGAFVKQDLATGQLSFEDDEDAQTFFNPFIFNEERDYVHFFRSELNSSLSCTNEQFSRHYDDLRFAYRLITLSYLLEGQWHMKLTSEKLKLKTGCQFDLKSWAKGCHPKTKDMSKLIDRLVKFDPKYDEELPLNYGQTAWNREIKAGLPIWYSQSRLQKVCKAGCTSSELDTQFTRACREDSELMTKICSEEDDLYGLAGQRDAYYLLAKSNIINTFNKEGEALGCLRRFSELMSHREAHYPVLKILFPTLEAFLIEKYNERFMQGRIFFYGAAKEFEEKGLADVFVTEKKVEKKPEIVLAKPTPKPSPEVKPKETPKVDPPRLVVAPPAEKKEVDTIKLKSAFLQAADIRASQNLTSSEVDMNKFRYDYVFSLNMINELSTKLKIFTTREALAEMLAYDQLGTKNGPVPLLFLKFLIDFQDHQGLWNLIAVIGDKFYVSNDIDTRFKPGAELIQLKNDDSTRRQWQIIILKP